MSRRLEDSHQEQLFKWLQSYPLIDCMTWATPNGGKRDAKQYISHDGKKVRYSREGAALKRRGVKRGVPDLFCAIPCNGYNGLFIELKAGDGTPSPEQKKMIENLLQQGYQALFCWGWFEARHAILDYFKDTDYVKRSQLSIADYKAITESIRDRRGRPRGSINKRLPPRQTAPQRAT